MTALGISIPAADLAKAIHSLPITNHRLTTQVGWPGTKSDILVVIYSSPHLAKWRVDWQKGTEEVRSDRAHGAARSRSWAIWE